MAVTKIHPIKSTLKVAINYICNPAKTDELLLVFSFDRSAEIADIEFAWTRRRAIDEGTNLSRRLIQAFEPGEASTQEVLYAEYTVARSGAKEYETIKQNVDLLRLKICYIFCLKVAKDKYK